MSVIAVVTTITALASTVRSVNQKQNALLSMDAAIKSKNSMNADAEEELWIAEQKMEAYTEYAKTQEELAQKEKIITIASTSLAFISAIIFVVQIRRG
tara:strand:+ start:5089 stop:5382 length:294 start_codon:yes stop_codon:yes gene_type:complete